MPRAHLLKTITDNAGNTLAGAQIRVLLPISHAPVTDPFYGADSGGTALSNPFTAIAGVASIYMDDPTRVCLGVTVGSNPEVIFDDLDVLEPAEGALQTAAQTTFRASLAVPVENVQDAIMYVAGLATGDNKHLGDGFNSTQVGSTAVASGDESLALGHGAQATTYQTTATGEQSEASGTGATATGQKSLANANQSTADGSDTIASGLRSNAQGAQAQATANDTNAVGFGAQATAARSQAYGSGAVSDTADVAVMKTDVFEIQPSGASSHATVVRLHADDDSPHEVGVSATGLTFDGAPLATGGGSSAFAVKTTNYTLTPDDDIVFFNGATLTATLPTPVGIPGQQYVIKNLNATVLVVAPTAGTIDGDASRTLAQYDAITAISDGTNWGVI